MTDPPVEGWTLEALKEHLETLIAATERRLEDLLDAERHLRLARREDDARAIDKAEESMTRRLDSMNELREQLNTQDKTFVTITTFRAELDKVSALVERNRQDIEQVRDLTLPRKEYENTVREWMAWRKAIDDFLKTRSGAERGLAVLGGGIVKLVALAVGVLTIVVVLADHFATK